MLFQVVKMNVAGNINILTQLRKLLRVFKHLWALKELLPVAGLIADEGVHDGD